MNSFLRSYEMPASMGGSSSDASRPRRRIIQMKDPNVIDMERQATGEWESAHVHDDEDSRIRTDRYDDERRPIDTGFIVRDSEPIPVQDAEPLLAKDPEQGSVESPAEESAPVADERSEQTMAAKKGKDGGKNKEGGKGGGQNQNQNQKKGKGKEWSTEEIRKEYDGWRKEYEELILDPTKPRRKEALDRRLIKADAKLALDEKQAENDVLYKEVMDLIKKEGEKKSEKNEFSQFKKTGSKTIEADRSLEQRLIQQLKELNEQHATTPLADINTQRDRLQLELENVQGIISRKEKAIASGDDWAEEFDQEINSLDTRYRTIKQSLEQSRQQYSEQLKAYLEEYKDVSFNDRPEDFDPLPTLYMNAKDVKEEPSKLKKVAVGTAVVGGATIGSMFVMAGGMLKDLWKSWRSHVNKPGTTFGGRGWRDFFWPGDKKKK